MLSTGIRSTSRRVENMINDNSRNEQEFDYSTPRNGKWTAEEEALANSLVEKFEEGSLLDCLEGTTLRCYLAKRLNCSPMRISKKFAGKCIGKVNKIYLFIISYKVLSF